MRLTTKAIILLSLCAAAFTTSCDKDKPETPETPIPVIRLSGDSVNINAAGGEASMTYTIENPVEGTSATAEASDEWISGVDVATAGTVKFQVAANESEAPREAVVTVSYSGAEDVSFKVIQEGKEEEAGITFKMNFEVEGTAVRMSVTPSDNEVYYYYDVVDKSELAADDYDSVLSYCKDQLALIFEGYESWGYTLEEALADFCSKGESSFRFPDLNEECDYYGFAYSLDEKGEISSKVAYEPFRTETIGESDNVLTIEVTDITSESAMLSITPSNEDQYTFLITYADDFAGMADEEILMMLLDGFELQPVTGKISNEMIGDLEPEVNYVVYAFGYQGGQATTGLFQKAFTTTAK